MHRLKTGKNNAALKFPMDWKYSRVKQNQPWNLRSRKFIAVCIDYVMWITNAWTNWNMKPRGVRSNQKHVDCVEYEYEQVRIENTYFLQHTSPTCFPIKKIFYNAFKESFSIVFIDACTKQVTMSRNGTPERRGASAFIGVDWAWLRLL